MHCHERSRRQAQCGGGDHNCITRFHAANMYSSVISTCSESRTMTERSGVSCVCALRSCAAMDGSDAERRERFIAANDSRVFTPFSRQAVAAGRRKFFSWRLGQIFATPPDGEKQDFRRPAAARRKCRFALVTSVRNSASPLHASTSSRSALL